MVMAYIKGFLPHDSLSCTDHYALQSYKKLLRRLEQADLRFESTQKQKEMTRVIVGFVTILSDQQLLTGLAILIAALASRCRLSLQEFRIVIFLVYFADFTHVLSLGVLRRHLFDRKLVRNCRVAFTIAFLAIFAVSFTANIVTLSFDYGTDGIVLSDGHALQCLFEASRISGSVNIGIVNAIFILGYMVISHVTAVLRLYFEPRRGPIGELTWKLHIYSLCCQGISEDDANRLLTKAENKYKAWLQPPFVTSKKTQISIWCFYDRYYNSYLSTFPEVVLRLAYGVGCLGVALIGKLEPLSNPQGLGFGQIVAIALLALTLLSMVEVITGKQSHYNHE
jgi:hypothetical protein